MKLFTLIQNAKAQLGSVSPSPLADIEYLLCHALQQDRSFLITHADYEISTELQEQFQALLARRLQGHPIAYLTGKQGFWKHDFTVNTATLIPRPETELLVETAIAALDPKTHCRILDLGTGSGAIAISLALESPHWQVIAVDNSPKALEVAKINALELNAPNVTFIESDWFQAIPQQRFDLIVANPPYIRAADAHLQQGDLRFEPETALISGETGLNAIRHITATAPVFLKSGRMLMIEHGYDQEQATQSLFKQAGFTDIKTLMDLNHLPRLTIGKMPGSK